MTREEVIKLLEHISIAYTPTDAYGDYDDPQPYEDALNMAIEALSAEANLTCKTCADRAMCIMSAPDGNWKACKDYRPSADAEAEAVQGEIVHCKDCRWYDNRYGDVCHNPRYGDGWANYPPPYVDEDYWCKDGERKGGDDE